ncbi:MAG: hypothetical protein M0P31_07940 [Solirubrobacteraceae bacterium]|nr:hypothetical protein [Solirubrobacteraceae bacterium]
MSLDLAVVAIAAAVVVPLALLADGWAPALADRIAALRLWWAHGRHGRRTRRDAERTARELLRTCLDAESWEMYRDLGFVRVWGATPRAPAPSGRRPPAGVAYAYLVYPHRPYVVYLPQTTTLLGECHVQLAGLDPASPLTATDDVLAHWMALTGDERGVLAAAWTSTPGGEISRRRVHRDLWRLREWERRRSEATATVRGRALDGAPGHPRPR